MSPEILLVPSSVMLVPGATGRVDLAREDRDVVVGHLVDALGTVHGRTPGTVMADRRRVRVTLVAPAPVESSRSTDRGIPDLGALGLSDEGWRDAQHAAATYGGAMDGGPLHVAASVATVLLRLAGWQDSIRTIEIGGGHEAASSNEVDTCLAQVGGSGEGVLDVAHLVVFTTLCARVRRVASRQPEERLEVLVDELPPSGVSQLLLQADQKVVELYREAVGRSSAGEQPVG